MVNADYEHLQGAARDHLWMHFTRHSTYEKQDVPIIVRGEGPYIYDAQGKIFFGGKTGAPAAGSALRLAASAAALAGLALQACDPASVFDTGGSSSGGSSSSGGELMGGATYTGPEDSGVDASDGGADATRDGSDASDAGTDASDANDTDADRHGIVCRSDGQLAAR